MTWFTEKRLAWIGEMLEIYGYINREHVERKFGVSTPQASADLREFDARFPGRMSYDRSAKRYTAALSEPPHG